MIGLILLYTTAWPLMIFRGPFLESIYKSHHCQEPVRPSKQFRRSCRRSVTGTMTRSTRVLGLSIGLLLHCVGLYQCLILLRILFLGMCLAHWTLVIVILWLWTRQFYLLHLRFSFYQVCLGWWCHIKELIACWSLCCLIWFCCFFGFTSSTGCTCCGQFEPIQVSRWTIGQGIRQSDGRIRWACGGVSCKMKWNPSFFRLRTFRFTRIYVNSGTSCSVSGVRCFSGCFRWKNIVFTSSS